MIQANRALEVNEVIQVFSPCLFTGVLGLPGPLGGQGALGSPGQPGVSGIC